MARSVHVLGAGIVGICVVLHLQRRGWSVTLVDRGEPGDETSFGHAGIISRGSVLPPNGPAIWRSIGQYASNRHPAVRYHMGFIARASLPMFLIMCVAVFLLVSFPDIATFLPSAMK